MKSMFRKPCDPPRAAREHSFLGSGECRVLVLGLLLICSCFAVSTQIPSGTAVKVPIVEGTDLRFSHLSFGEGASCSRVSHIVQDDQGFLWFGTQDGLKHYDGYRLREYRHDPRNPSSLSGSYINALFKDSSGKLWVASDQYLDRYDPATEIFTHYRSDQIEGAVSHIGQDREGIIWLATNHGLNRVDPVSGQMVSYRHNPDDSASLGSNLVRSTFEENDGTFWVATTESLDIFDRRTGKVTRHLPLRGRPMSAVDAMIHLFEDHTGVLWVTFSSGNGLAVVDRGANSLKEYSFQSAGSGSSSTSGVVSIFEDQQGTLWLGTNNSGLLKLDRNRKEFVRYRNDPGDPDSLSTDEVLAVFQGREGNIWIGTQGGGVNQLTAGNSAFKRYKHNPGNPNSLDTNFVSSVYEDSHGILWVGTRKALNRIDRKTGRFTFYRTAGGPGNLSSTFVISIIEDRSGYLWFGTFGAGLNRFDRRTGRFKVYRHDPADAHSLSHDTVLDLFLDHKGTLWAGTEDGLSALDPQTDHFRVYKASAVERNRYRDMEEDSDGTLWLATWDAGVQHFDPATGRFTVYRHSATPGSLSSDEVDDICIDHTGTIWAGTHTGLNRFDRATGTFTVYTERDGLPNSNLTGILEDKQGDLWLSTNNGISRFNPRDQTFKNYSTSDGILGNEFYGYNTPWKSPSGEMFFGSYGGLTAFFPDKVVDNPYIPAVVLTDFQIFGRPVLIGGDSPLKQSISLTNSLTLSHAQSIFSFEFSALSYTNPGRNRYRYRLEGLETQWNETDSNRRFVIYTTLAPGEYVFRVQGSNNRGVWNERGATVRIRILPPWWSTWWFRASVAASLLFSLLCVYHIRVRQLAAQFDMRLEERVSERTRIARDLHDTLLQSFQGLVLRFQAVRNQLPNRPEKACEVLDSALISADQAIAEGRSAIQELRSGSSQESNLEQMLLATGRELASSQNGGDSAPPLRVIVEGNRRAKRAVIREEIYRIARELLRNAYRHAHAQSIEAELRYDDDVFLLIVRDDGKGIDPKVLKDRGRAGHWGLPGTYERAEGIGARLDIWSEVGAGTEVRLTVPGAIAYEKSGDSSRFKLFRKTRIYERRS